MSHEHIQRTAPRTSSGVPWATACSALATTIASRTAGWAPEQLSEGKPSIGQAYASRSDVALGDPAAAVGSSAMRELRAVFAGGALGALARTGLGEAWPVVPGQWPWATFGVNAAGCLVLGAVLVLTAPGTPRRGLLGAGLCGGLTTFSALQIELVTLLRDGDVALAVAYAGVSVVVGLAGVEAGRRLAGGAPSGHGPTEVPEE